MDKYLIKILNKVYTIKLGQLVEVSATIDEANFNTNGFNLTDINSLSSIPENAILLELTSNEVSKDKEYIYESNEPAIYNIEVNDYITEKKLGNISGNVDAIPASAFTKEINPVNVIAYDKEGIEVTRFTYDIIKEDRDTFEIERRLQYDESHLIPWDIDEEGINEYITANKTADGCTIYIDPKIILDNIKTTPTYTVVTKSINSVNSEVEGGGFMQIIPTSKLVDISNIGEIKGERVSIDE